MKRRIHSNEGQFLQAFGCLVSLDFPYGIPSGHGLEHNINSKENQTVQEPAAALEATEVASVVSNSVRPHRRQPTGLPCPWDSPGKNTGVGCYFLLQCMNGKSESEVTQSCPTLRDPMDYSLQAPLSMGFSRQEYWSGLPSPSLFKSLELV